MPMASTILQIAIVDDDEGVRRSLGRLVRTLHYETFEFSSAEAFLASLPASRPSCVLMDLHLPGLNGLETLERLCEDDRSPPVIIMTGFDEPGTRERCLAAGAVDYMTKPIEVASLCSVFDRVLKL
jgi:FixJ family two-component response regulator